MLEHIKQEFPFWNYEITRLEHYIDMLNEGNLPLEFVLGVVKNYLIIAEQENLKKDLEELYDELKRRDTLKPS
jgi:hypothetical protein